MERDGLHHVTLPKTHHMKMTTTTQSIPTRSSPGTRTTPSVAGHQDGGEKYATDDQNRYVPEQQQQQQKPRIINLC